ncbi:MAG: protein kinase [Planctomycetota bacterium]|nr:protein kinase [Planctomycetota bacterium]
MSHNSDSDPEPELDPLSPAEILFARLLGGTQSIGAAVDHAARENPAIAGELQHHLQEYQRRRNERLARTEMPANPNSDALAERLLDRYSEDLDLSNPLESGDSVPLIPELEGRYDFLEEIARGGMGAVLKISDPVLQRELAMKVVLGNKAGDAPPQRLRRFLREARVTAQLSHPGVVSVHELNSDADGRFYFTMDRVLGQELRDFIRYARDGTAGWDRNRLLEVLLKVCDTLEYAHSRGIVHRDVKPANIMVGQFGEVYVMDWGLARILADIEDEPLEDVISDSLATSQGGSTVITRDGSVVGTPSYMSPEQASPEDGTIGPWTDVYSIGALFYEILSGSPPYRSGDLALPGHKVLRLLQKGPPIDIQEKSPETPDDLANICRLAMQRNPADRPASAGQISTLLRDVLRARAAVAENVEKAQVLAKRSREMTQFLTDLFLSESGENPSLHRISAHSLLDQGAQDLLSGMDEQPQTRASLLSSLASILLETGAAERATELLQAETKLRDDHPFWTSQERVDAYRKLARAHQRLRRLSEAEEALQKALESVSPESPAANVEEIQHELAELLNVRGDHPQAEEICRDLLVSIAAQPKINQVPYMITLAQAITLQGYPEEARDLLNQIIELVGDEHPEQLATVLLHRAGTILELATGEATQQDLEMALVDLTRSVQLQTQLRGARSDHTSRHLRALACCQQRCGDLQAAEQSARSALMSIRQLHVIHHPLCARSYARLASILLCSGQTMEAQKLIEEADMTLRTGQITADFQFSTLEARVRIHALAGRQKEAFQLLEELDRRGGELPAARLKRRKDLDQICSESGMTSSYEE